MKPSPTSRSHPLRLLALLAGAFAGLSAIMLTLPAAANERNNPFARILLDEQNKERARTGADPLTWNASLAYDAQIWADHLARTGRFEHADYETRKNAGENLWKGSAGYFSFQEMIDQFLIERRDFRPGTFPKVSRTGNWHDVGHYTQIIWRDTQEVGCAVARSRNNDVLVCRYFPMGNVIGEKIG